MKTDVTGLAPRSRPRITNKPILLAVFFAITNQDDSVIDIGINLVAAVEDAVVIGVPVVSIDGDCYWTKAGYCVQQLKVVVGGQLYEA